MKQYEEGLFRCYVAGGDPWDLPQGQTHYLEYDRDKQAERAVAAWEAVAIICSNAGRAGRPTGLRFLAAELPSRFPQHELPEMEAAYRVLLAVADAIEEKEAAE